MNERASFARQRLRMRSKQQRFQCKLKPDERAGLTGGESIGPLIAEGDRSGVYKLNPNEVTREPIKVSDSDNYVVAGMMSRKDPDMAKPFKNGAQVVSRSDFSRVGASPSSRRKSPRSRRSSRAREESRSTRTSSTPRWMSCPPRGCRQPPDARLAAISWPGGGQSHRPRRFKSVPTSSPQ